MSAPPPTARPQSGISRRGVLTGAAAAGAAAAVPIDLLSGSEAEAAYRPRVRHYGRTALPSRRALHLANRFSYGYTPALRHNMKKAGGPDAWFLKQLHPERITDRHAASFESWFPNL